MSTVSPHIDSDFDLEAQERENIESEMQIHVGKGFLL